VTKCVKIMTHLTCQIEKMVIQVSVGHDFDKIIVLWDGLIQFQEDLLPSKHEC